MSALGQPTLITLAEAQDWAWQQTDHAPRTIQGTLGQVQESARQASRLFEQEQIVFAQTSLEDTLLHILLAMRLLGIDPQQGLLRAGNRARQSEDDKAFYVYPDRVELRSHGELRGEWPLFTRDDYEAAIRMAHELGCQIIHSDARQLELFPPCP